jgi:NADPH2:quinone reductase
MLADVPLHRRATARGAVKPLVGRRLSLEQSPEALRILERREAVGKVVVDIRTDAEPG